MDDSVVNIDTGSTDEGFCSVNYGAEQRRLDERYGEGGHGLPDEERDRVFDTAARILARCPSPSGPPRQRTGLALGKVQSGKTLSYIALSTLAFDSGYRVVVVLAGRTHALADQNRRRFEEDLLGGRNLREVSLFHNPGSQDQREIRDVLDDGQRIVITLLKTQARISKVRDILASAEVSNHPMLIIDDEGDQASLNTQESQGEESAVHGNIRRLREAVPLHAYVAYTATPQANLLIRTINTLAPEFAVLLEPGSGYTGGATFFGPDRDRYIRYVPDDEAEHDDLEGVPERLRLAIATFLVAGAILHLRGEQKVHSMLIHHSNRTTDHSQLQEAVENLIDNWRQALQLSETDPGAQAVLSLARAGYDDLSTTAEECPSWEEVRPLLERETRSLKVWLVNSLPQGSNPVTSSIRLRNNIMIGGNMLDRGVTIDELAVTYITRRARTSQADTVEQRARWFGYKERYLDICRVYTSRDLAEVYTELLQHENDFWASLQRYEDQGLPVTEWPRLFRLGLGMRPTRTAVARTRAFRSGGWISEGRPSVHPDTAAHNVSLVECFFSNHPDARSIQYGDDGPPRHLSILGCDPEEATHLLSQMEDTEARDWDLSYLIEYLERLILAGRLSGIDVLLMGDGEPRTRTYQSNGTIEPQEGRRKRADGSSAYAGDGYIHNDRVQLQVHIVQTRERRDGPLSDRTTALALYMPHRRDYDLGPLQVPSG